MNNRTVRDVMTQDVVWVRPLTPFRTIAEVLAKRRIGSVPVVSTTQQVVGLVSEADLIDKYELRAIEHRPPRWSPTRRRLWDKAIATVAADLMTSPAITLAQDTSVTSAARLFAEKGLKRAPVVDEKDCLVGILSRHDLVSVFVRTDQNIEDEIREEVLVRALSMDPHGITVQVVDGVVTLHGQVERRSMVPMTIHLTWSVDGVVDVIDRLTFGLDDAHVGDGTVAQNVGVLHSVRFKH